METIEDAFTEKELIKLKRIPQVELKVSETKKKWTDFSIEVRKILFSLVRELDDIPEWISCSFIPHRRYRSIKGKVSLFSINARGKVRHNGDKYEIKPNSLLIPGLSPEISPSDMPRGLIPNGNVEFSLSSKSSYLLLFHPPTISKEDYSLNLLEEFQKSGNHDVLNLILSYLDGDDLLYLALTSKYMNKLLTKDKLSFWRILWTYTNSFPENIFTFFAIRYEMNHPTENASEIWRHYDSIYDENFDIQEEYNQLIADENNAKMLIAAKYGLKSLILIKDESPEYLCLFLLSLALLNQQTEVIELLMKDIEGEYISIFQNFNLPLKSLEILLKQLENPTEYDISLIAAISFGNFENFSFLMKKLIYEYKFTYDLDSVEDGKINKNLIENLIEGRREEYKKIVLREDLIDVEINMSDPSDLTKRIVICLTISNIKFARFIFDDLDEKELSIVLRKIERKHSINLDLGFVIHRKEYRLAKILLKYKSPSFPRTLMNIQKREKRKVHSLLEKAGYSDQLEKYLRGYER